MQPAARPHEPARLTWDDFLALAEEDRRELFDGELMEVDVPTLLHEHIVMLLGWYLVGWSRQHERCTVLASGYRVRVSEHRAFMPDIQLYRGANPARIESQGLAEGHPDLVVEVVSPSSGRYDRVVKLNGYAELGVPEYWVVDPAEQSLQQFVLRDGLYLLAAALGGDSTFTPTTFPGMTVPLAELWTPVPPPAEEAAAEPADPTDG